MEDDNIAGPYRMNLDPRFTTSSRDNGSPRPPSRSPGRSYRRSTRSVTPYPRSSSPSHSQPPQPPQHRSPARSGAPYRSSSYRQTSRISPYPQAFTSPTPRNSVSIAASSYMVYDPMQAYQQSFPSELSRPESPPPPAEDEFLEIPTLLATRVRPAASFLYTRELLIERPPLRMPDYEMPGRFPESPGLPQSELPGAICGTPDPTQFEAHLPQVHARLVHVQDINTGILELAFSNPRPLSVQLPGADGTARSRRHPDRQFRYQHEVEASMPEPLPASGDGFEGSSDTLCAQSSETYNTMKSPEQIESDARTHPVPQWDRRMGMNVNGGGAVAESSTSHDRIAEMARREEYRRARTV